MPALHDPGPLVRAVHPAGLAGPGHQQVAVRRPGQFVPGPGYQQVAVVRAPGQFVAGPGHQHIRAGQHADEPVHWHVACLLGPAAPSGPACVTSADKGVCGPYSYSGITSPNGQGTNVIQDIWNPISGASQTLTSYNPGDWSVSANMPASNKAVVSYPDVQQIYTESNGDADPLSNFHSITSSYNESGPATGDYEAAYDIWANNGSLEIMLWVDNHGQAPAGSVVATPTIGGTGYSVHQYNSTVSMVLNSQSSSGTVDLLAALNWLKSNGYEPSDLAINQIDFGWEICSTGGTTQKFSMNNFTIKSS